MKLHLKNDQWTARKRDQEWTGYHQHKLYLTWMVQPVDTVMLNFWYKTKQNKTNENHWEPPYKPLLTFHQVVNRGATNCTYWDTEKSKYTEMGYAKYQMLENNNGHVIVLKACNTWVPKKCMQKPKIEICTLNYDLKPINQMNNNNLCL